MEKKQDIENPESGLGCKVLLLLVLGCFVFAGIIFFVGQFFGGDRGSYYLFYSILILAIISAIGYQYLTIRNRKRNS